MRLIDYLMTQDVVKEEASRTLKKYVGQVCNKYVLQKRIFAVYPECNFGIRSLMHGLINPREECLNS